MATKALQIPASSLNSARAREEAKALIRPDVWATLLELKVDAKPFTTDRRKYITQVMRDQSDEIVIKKAAQMCFTVGMIVKTLHCATVRGWHGMYLLPFKQGARTFVQSRVDPIIDSHPLLTQKFHRVENVSHKQTDDNVNLYFRGTNIATELREVPVDFEIWDERDKFVTTYLGDARARMDGSDIAKLVEMSTPTGPGIGVDSDDNWRQSDQCLWEVPCPHCNRSQVLRWDESVKIGDGPEDTIIECVYCHRRITDRQRWEINDLGRWTPQYLNGKKRGYHISQLNSPTKRFFRIAQAYFDGLEDSQALRDFHNLVLGEPYAGQGDKFTEKILDDAAKVIPGLTLRTIPQGPLHLGIDVGSRLHCKASYLARDGKRIMWDAKIFRSFDDLDAYLGSLHNFSAVIDAHPEKAKAKELAKKYKGRIWLGLEKDNPRQTEIAVFDDKKMEVSIDRTMAFDQYIGDHTKGTYALPANVRELGEHMPKKNFNGFMSHHLEMVRVQAELPGGILTYRWAKTRNPDHWHHAGMFESIAFQRKPPLHIPASMHQALQAAGRMVSG